MMSDNGPNIVHVLSICRMPFKVHDQDIFILCLLDKFTEKIKGGYIAINNLPAESLAEALMLIWNTCDANFGIGVPKRLLLDTCEIDGEKAKLLEKIFLDDGLQVEVGCLLNEDVTPEIQRAWQYVSIGVHSKLDELQNQGAKEFAFSAFMHWVSEEMNRYNERLGGNKD